MRGSNVIRIQQSRGGSFVGGTGIGCLRKNCGTEDEERWNYTDLRHSGASLSKSTTVPVLPELGDSTWIR
jgi:hypothetical protein